MKEKKMDEALLPRKERSIWEIPTRELTVEEFKKMSFIGAPFMAVAMSQYLLLGVSMMMAGHLGELAPSGVAIATAFCNVTGFSLLVIETSLYLFNLLMHASSSLQWLTCFYYLWLTVGTLWCTRNPNRTSIWGNAIP